MTIGEKLVERRKALGLQQKDVAERMGVSAPTISGYERNTRKPKYETLLRFAAALECSVADLIDIDPANGDPTEGEDVAQIAATQDVDPLDRMNQAAEKLNRPGQTVAADFVETLATVPQYQKGHSTEG